MKKIIEFLKNTGEKIQNTHPRLQIFAFSGCGLILFMILTSFLFHPLPTRSVFYFKDARTGWLCTEIRYLPPRRGIDARLSLFTDELLLGPLNPGYSRIFNKNVRRVTCFVRDKAAYIDISPASPFTEPGVLTNNEGFDLFKKNVFTNFRKLAKIYMYMDGIEVYSENLDESAILKK